MHYIPWYIALLISFPQTILILEFGFRLFNIRLRTKNVLLLGVIIAGLCYLLRPFAIPYALNTLILIPLLSILSCFIGRIRFRYCFISVTLGHHLRSNGEFTVVVDNESFASFYTLMKKSCNKY